MATELILPSALTAGETYRLMIDLVAPRPIAWIATVDGEGRGNLAPMSYFQAVCSHPPMVVVSIASHPDGRPKDTLRNILETGEFTVSHVSEDLVDAMNLTAADYPAETSEWKQAKVEPAASHLVGPPRVAQSPAAMECKLLHAIPLGQGPSTTLVLAEVVAFQLAEGLAQRDGRGRLLPIDPARLASVGRLGGMAYTKTREVFELRRPSPLLEGAK